MSISHWGMIDIDTLEYDGHYVATPWGFMFLNVCTPAVDL